MIFRTITDDITGANKSIGLFGKSLDNVKNIIYSFQTNGVKNTLFNTPLTNIDTKAIDRYNAAIQASVPFEKALDTARRTTNAETVALIESTNGATVSTEALTTAQQSSTVAAKAHSAALKAVSMASNMILFIIIAKGIQLAATAIDNYIHRVEKARERTDELLDEFKDMNNTLADHRQVVADLADRYDELSKGVNLSTNDNVSLSTEEYEEFLDINEQLVQSFPELAKGIDENGNSILTLGTNGITAKEQLEELLQTEEDLNNFRIAQGLDEAFKGVYTYVEDANEATEKLNGTISDSNEAMSKLQDIAENGIKLSGDNGQLIFAGNTNNQAEIDYMNSLTQSINEFWKSLDGSRRVELGVEPSYLFTQQFDEYTGAFEIYANLYQLTPEEITTLENIIQDNVGDASGALLDSISDQSQELQEQINKGENAWRDFIPNLVSGMKSKQTFKDLDSDLQDIAVQIVEGLDYSYASAMKEYDPDPYAYIRDKFIVPMSKLSDDDKQKLQSSFEELLKLDADNLAQSNQAEIEKLITTIANLLNKDPLEIRIALGFDTEDIQNRYNEALKQAKRQLGGYGHDDRGFEVNNDIGNWLDTLSEKELEIANSPTFTQALARQEEGLDGAALSAKNYQNALEEVEAQQNKISNTFSSLSSTDFLNKFETQYKPALSAIQTSMNEVMEATENGIELKVDSESAIAAITDIRNAVDEINSSEEIDFHIDTSSVDEFADKLMNALDSGDLNAVKQTYTDFANDIVSSMQDMFGEIDETNMQAAQKALESVGILNAEQIIAAQTGYSYEEYSAAKEAAANAGVNLNGTVEEVVAQLDAEGLAATDDAQAIMEYMIKKAAASGMGIDVSGAIAALGEEWEWLQALIEQWGRYNSVSQKGHGNTSGTKNLGSGMYNPVVPEKVETDVEVDLKFPSLDSSAKKAGKSAGKSLKDGLKEELSDLEGVISGITGRIDDQISSINEQKSAALDSIDAQKEALEEAKDAAVEALEEERDARLEVIETQKAQLEEQIKLIEKQIKSKQDEIDRINKAAEARAREISLQEKQYALEQKRNQRTKLVYTESSGIIYRPDEQGIRKAKEEVDDTKRQIEIANIQKEIDLLEDQKDLLSEQITLLDEQADAVNKYYKEQISQTEKYYDNLLKNLEKQRKETEAYYESITKYLEQRKDKFQELTEILEKAELSAKLKQLGIDEEALLNGSEEEFNKLKDAYMNIVFQLNEGNDEVLNKLRELSGYEGTAPAMLEESNTKLGTMNDELGTANTEVGNVNSSLDKTASTTSDVATNVSDVNTNIGETTGLVNEQKGSFDELKQTIDLIVEAINQKIQAIETGQSTVASAVGSEMANFQLLINKILEVKEKLDSVNDTVATMNRQPIDNLTSAFQLLYDKLLLVSNLLGVGVEGEGAVNGISGAIQALNEISLEEGIIAQFTNLKTAIDSVTAAISGGGGESSEGASSGGTSGSKGGKQGGASGKGSEGESGGGGNSLTGAIESMGETAKEVIGEPDAEGDGTVIGEFGSMETAVNDVRDAIGTEGSAGGEGGKSGSGGKGESDDTLVGSIEYLGDKTDEEMGESDGNGILGKFNEFKGVIEEAANQVKSISEGLDEIDGKEVECSITVNVKMNGSIPAFASGTVLGNMQIESATYNAQYGKTFASGTIGLKHDEKNALRSEYGQPELTVYPNGTTELTTSPVMSDLPKGTVIYNEEETKKIMDNKSNPVGNAHADGTDDSIWTTLADGSKVRPLQPGDKMWDLYNKFDAYLKSMDGNIEKLVPNSLYEHQRQMEDMAKQINYVSSVVNNNRNVQQPIVNNINVTCPGVTSKEVAQQVGVELNNMFNGLHLEAMQQSMMR